MRRSWTWLQSNRLGALVLAEVVGAGAISFVLGTPSGPLPEWAFKAHFLYELERAVAFFAVFYAPTVVILWSFRGRLASRIGREGMEFAADIETVARKLEDQVDALNEAVGDHANVLDEVVRPRLRAVERAVARLEARP